jgi:hypothetical protein
MDAISALFDATLAKVSSLGLFASVEPALNCGQLALPSAEVWFAEDKLVTDKPAITRELSFAVQVTVGHKENGTAQTVLHPILDTLRTKFSGWLPDFVGMMPCTVPTIKIASHEDHGKTVYVMQILFRVYIDTFSAKQ